MAVDDDVIKTLENVGSVDPWSSLRKIDMDGFTYHLLDPSRLDFCRSNKQGRWQFISLETLRELLATREVDMNEATWDYLRQRYEKADGLRQVPRAAKGEGRFYFISEGYDDRCRELTVSENGVQIYDSGASEVGRYAEEEELDRILRNALELRDSGLMREDKYHKFADFVDGQVRAATRERFREITSIEHDARKAVSFQSPTVSQVAPKVGDPKDKPEWPPRGRPSTIGKNLRRSF